MVGRDGEGCVVPKEANDIQIGHARLDHHDVRAFSLIGPQLPQGFPVVGRVLLVRLLVGGDDAFAGAISCTSSSCQQQQQQHTSDSSAGLNVAM